MRSLLDTMGGILFSPMRCFSPTARNLREATARNWLVTTRIWDNVVAHWLGHANTVVCFEPIGFAALRFWGSWMRYSAIRSGCTVSIVYVGYFSKSVGYVWFDYSVDQVARSFLTPISLSRTTWASMVRPPMSPPLSGLHTGQQHSRANGQRQLPNRHLRR